MIHAGKLQVTDKNIATFSKVQREQAEPQNAAGSDQDQAAASNNVPSERGSVRGPRGGNMQEQQLC